MANYLRFCYATTKWQSTGFDDIENALQEGPVIIVSWHSRLMYSGLHWNKKWGRIKPLHDKAPAGRLAGGTLKQLGLEPIAMSAAKSNLTISRTVLREIHSGVSVGMAADGPLGPSRICKPHPIGWARSSGRPIFVYAWSTRNAKRLNTWDKLMFPLPFSKGAYSYVRWEKEVPRKLDAEGFDALCTNLADHLDAVTGRTDDLAEKSRDV